MEPGIQLVTVAGEQTHPSVLKVGQDFHTANPGKDSTTTEGGAGYSGGGMAGGFNGGTNAGNGDGDGGGAGSMFDISTVKFNSLDITPAAGGTAERNGSIICSSSSKLWV